MEIARGRTMEDTGTDWRGTPLRAGARAVWVVANIRAVEGEVVSWSREDVVVRPLRRSCVVVGGVPKDEAHDLPGGRLQAIARMKVTVLEGAS